jgi:flagellar hook-associated protein 2
MVDSISGSGGGLNGSGISFSGVASGIDTDALIAALTKLESKPIEIAKAKQKKLQSLSALVKALSTKLSALRDAAASLTTLGQALAFTATSSDPSKVTASTTTGAAVGPHTISVTQLATAASTSLTLGAPIADPTAALSNTGSLHVNYAGTAASIDVTGKSLNEIRDAINAGVPGVTASVVNVGASGSPDYRLVVTGKESGAVKTLTFTQDGGVAFNFTSITTAKNAMFKVDGVDIQRDSNTVGDVIPGVSFTLLAPTATGADVTLSISTDVSAVKTKIKKMIDVYNEVVSFINANGTYDAASKTAGAFFGDNSITSIKSNLATLFLTGGAEYASDEAFNSLSQLGVKLQSDGTLLLDDAKLTDKLSTDMGKALDLFADTDGPGADLGLALKVRDYAIAATSGGNDPVTGTSYDGILTAKTKSISDQLAYLTKQINAGEDHVAKFSKMLKLKYMAFESAISKLKAQQSALYAKFG